MDGLMTRHEAISSNLANVDTPGYKAVRVEFENQLLEAIKKEDQLPASNGKNNTLTGGMLELKMTNLKHLGAKPISLGELQINSYQDANISFKNDNNAVDIETELSELAKSDLKYEAIANLESKNSNMIKETIRIAGGV